MYTLSGSPQFPSPRGPAHTTQLTPVGECIRQAEQHIAERNFSLAQESLAQAWKLDPGNPYIPAIVERMEILQSMLRDSSTGRIDSASSPGHLSVTVGKQFPGGFKRTEASTSATPDQDRTRIHRMASVALSLLERGSVDAAFETFMKAYVLDPMNADVLDCAASVIPAWEAQHTRSAMRTSAALRRWTDVPGAAAVEAQRIAGGYRSDDN